MLVPSRLVRRIALAASLLAAAPAVLLAQPSASAAGSARADAATASGTYAIDVTHSELQFRIRHLVSRVNGTFNTWKGTITVPDAGRWETAQIDVEIQTASIDTKNERRDTHLRTNEFFDAPNHPTITFRSTKIERSGEAAKIHGNLTMRGVTKPVVLEGTLLGASRTAQGKTRVGFEAKTVVNRMDYGVSWNRAAEAGGLTLGDEVTIEITVAAVQQ